MTCLVHGMRVGRRHGALTGTVSRSLTSIGLSMAPGQFLGLAALNSLPSGLPQPDRVLHSMRARHEECPQDREPSIFICLTRYRDSEFDLDPHDEAASRLPYFRWNRDWGRLKKFGRRRAARGKPRRMDKQWPKRRPYPRGGLYSGNISLYKNSVSSCSSFGLADMVITLPSRCDSHSKSPFFSLRISSIIFLTMAVSMSG